MEFRAQGSLLPAKATESYGSLEDSILAGFCGGFFLAKFQGSSSVLLREFLIQALMTTILCARGMGLFPPYPSLCITPGDCGFYLCVHWAEDMVDSLY